MINKIKKLFKKDVPFKCGGESTVEFVGRGQYAWIKYRQPTGDEVLNFVHMTLDSEQSTLKDFSNSVNVYNLHKIARQKKFIPFAKAVITSFGGYVDENGNDIKDINLIEKYFPHHLENVSIIAHSVNDSFKKKD